jgi:hypothetical protein
MEISLTINNEEEVNRGGPVTGTGQASGPAAWGSEIDVHQHSTRILKQ